MTMNDKNNNEIFTDKGKTILDMIYGFYQPKLDQKVKERELLSHSKEVLEEMILEKEKGIV